MGEVILSAKQIKAGALRLGFSACGVAPAEAVNETVSNAFCHWHSHGMQAGMNYMGNHLEKRLDPRFLAFVAAIYLIARFFAFCGRNSFPVLNGKIRQATA